MRPFITYAILASFVFVGCGQKKKNDTPTNIIKMKQGESLSTFTENLTIDTKTPEGVGTLLALQDGKYTERNVGLCTWFLVGRNRAMTNSHCIPEALKKDKALSCEDYIQGGFQTKSGLRKVRCKKLLFVSDISQAVVLNNDYALLELEKDITDTQVYILDRRGIAENEKIKILTMNHYAETTGVFSEFKEHNCVMKSSDILGKISSFGASPLAGFKEEGTAEVCKAIEGNSGSPVVDVSGRLLGILHGAIKDGIDLSKGFSFSSSDFTNHVAILTNLRCQKFNDRNLDADYPESCRQETKSTKLDQNELMKDVEAKVTKLLQEAVAKQPSILEYDVEAKNQTGSSLISLSPKCIKPLKNWDEAFSKSIYKEGFFSRKKGIRTKFENQRLDFFTRLDYYGNLKIDVTLKNTETIHLNITGLQDLEEKKEVSAFVGPGENGTTFVRKIPRCG